MPQQTGRRFSAWLSETLNKSEYTDAEEGPSRTKHSTSSEERNKVEELLQTEPQDTDLAASFLQDH